MKILFQLLVILGLSAASVANTHGVFLFGLDDLEQSVEDDPKPCCLPETWEGSVQTIFGSAEGRGRTSGASVTTKTFVDGQKKRVAGNVFTGCPRADLTFVGFYNESSGKGFRLYSFKTVNATKCWSHYWDQCEYQKPCIPSNANFTGSLTVGPKSSGLATNSFRLMEHSGKFSFLVDIVVTQNGCIPISLREVGEVRGRRDEEDYNENDRGRLVFSSKPKPRRNGKKFVIGSLYGDLEMKISDDKVFNIPDICKKNVERYPLDLDQIRDPELRGGFENLDAILEHMLV